MRLEQRAEFLLRAALRAERDGEHQIARSLRRMAADIQPIDRSLTLALQGTAGP
jgi:hypothetical protein